MRDDLHLPDDGGPLLRRPGLPNRGHLHAEHQGVPIGYKRGASDVHDHTRRERGQL